MDESDDWKEPTLYEGKFRDGGSRLVTFRVAIPVRKGSKSCLCKFQFVGCGDDAIRQVSGVDELQALVSALQHALRVLAPLNLAEEVGGSPIEMIIPEFIPIGYGLEFRNYLSTLVQLQVKKKELAIAEDRRSKEKRSRR